MKEIILACGMLRGELEAAMKKTGSTIPVEWVEEGLHEWPTQLQAELRKQISALEKTYDTIILAYALCGNAIVGLGSERAKLVAIRFDDCLRMQLALEHGQTPQMDSRCMYYTKTWTESKNFLKQQIDETCAKYGKEKGERIYKKMVAHYTGLRLIENGTYDPADCEGIVRETAGRLGLDYGTDKGTIRVLEKLVTHQWDDDFYVIEPGQTFEQLPFLRLT